MKNKIPLMEIKQDITSIAVLRPKLNGGAQSGHIVTDPVCTAKERVLLDQLYELEKKTGKEDYLERAVGLLAGRTKKRPELLQGCSYKITAYTPNKVNYYITLNHVVERGQRFIYEIFINTSEVSHMEWISVITRQLSALFKIAKDRDLEYGFIFKTLKNTFSSHGYFAKGLKMNVPGVQAHIGIIIERHILHLEALDENDRIYKEVLENGAFQEMIDNINETREGVAEIKVMKPCLDEEGHTEDDFNLDVVIDEPEDEPIRNDLAFCTECNTNGLSREGGCARCINCGFDAGCG